ncbi:hypothetical protein ACHAWU_005900 [Discostella pseudostelligera]|uniref:SAM domain-containing protein n=1 Tax=Discostella pseudostelligera TaxID=259834 RepID=A0ABD3N1U9_9STRA
MIDHPKNKESIACLEELHLANKRLEDAHDNVEKEYSKLVEELVNEEKVLVDRLKEISTQIDDVAEEHGNVDAADNDVLEINAGGKIFIAKRSTLTQHTLGTRFGALFIGRWEKKLQRDLNGRIFLDVNPECFQAIVSFLNEMMISTKSNPPDPPSVDGEHNYILSNQLCLFKLWRKVGAIAPQSQVVTSEDERNKLLYWLKKQGVHGEPVLLYSGSRDGLAPASFRDKCDNKGCVIFIMNTVHVQTQPVYSGSYDCSKTTKMETLVGFYSTTESFVDYLGTTYGSKVSLCSPASRYKVIGETTTTQQNCYRQNTTFSITQLEAFKVIGPISSSRITTKKDEPVQRAPTKRFSSEINKVINEKQACLPKTELKIRSLEDSFKDEKLFIEKFAAGDAKDVIALNVSGTPMVTRRSTLCTIEDSVLAQQFDDSKWAEQAYSASLVKSWSPDEVSTWAKNIEGIQEDVGSVFKMNGITGCELLALNMDGLKMLGIERAGTLCLLKKEIETLEKASQVVTLIDHCPYCFGKILDYLRMKQAHSLGLADEPTVPEIIASQKKRFEKVVKFYFPGDAFKLFLG